MFCTFTLVFAEVCVQCQNGYFMQFPGFVLFSCVAEVFLNDFEMFSVVPIVAGIIMFLHSSSTVFLLEGLHILKSSLVPS